MKLLADTTDTTRHRAQYLITAGFTRSGLRASVSDRIRAFRGDIYNSPEIQAGFDSRAASINLRAERDGVYERTIFDGAFRVTPVAFLALAGGVTYERPNGASADLNVPDSLNPGQLSITFPKSMSARLEAGIRVGNPWLIAGYMTRDTAVLAAPAMIDTAYQVRAVGKRSGLYAGVRGKLYKDLNIDVVGMRWDSAGFYQPRYQARGELFVDTRWLRKFPSGTFGLKLAAIHEYRDDVRFPVAGGFRTARASNITSGLVEIRILRGVATYQARNIFARDWQIYPGFFMHRTINIYGLRWEFWN
jgi:hypothetical protein